MTSLYKPVMSLTTYDITLVNLPDDLPETFREAEQVCEEGLVVNRNNGKERKTEKKRTSLLSGMYTTGVKCLFTVGICYR